MNAPGYFFHWHFSTPWAPVDIYISAANVLVIGLMILVFILAVVLPFPGKKTNGS